MGIHCCRGQPGNGTANLRTAPDDTHNIFSNELLGLNGDLLNFREFEFEVLFYTLAADRGLYMRRQNRMESGTAVSPRC